MPQGIVVRVQPIVKGKNKEPDQPAEIEVIAIKNSKGGIVKGETYLFIDIEEECSDIGKGESVKIKKIISGNRVEINCKARYKCKRERSTTTDDKTE